jgi:hypothetical protein
MKLFTQTETWLLILALAIVVVFFAACDHVYAGWTP